MNIATGKLKAPIVKKAGLLDPAVIEGALGTLKGLATSKGLLGASAPLDSYALSAGLGAGASEATKRLLQNRFKDNPKLLKALSASMGYSAGGGAGLAASIASPLAPVISKGSGTEAARSLAELTAIGTGGELVASPFINAALKSGNPDGAMKTLGKMFGGGALAGAGVIARDKRNADFYIQQYLAGNLPKGLPKPNLSTGVPSVLDLAKRRKDSLQKALPGGSLYALGGAGLLASGSPLLGAASLLAAPMANKNVSQYVGTVAKEFNKAKKTEKALDSLYKKSSYSVDTPKLAAPVYMTMPYCLDAPTMDKVAVTGLLREVGSWGANLLSGMSKQQKQIARQGKQIFKGSGGRRQGQDMLRANVEARALEAGASKINPAFEQNVNKMDQGGLFGYRNWAAKRRQRFTPQYEVDSAAINRANTELGSTAGVATAKKRMQSAPVQQAPLNAPGAVGPGGARTSHQGQVYTSHHSTGHPIDAGALANTPKGVSAFERLGRLEARVAGGGSLNRAEQAELNTLKRIEFNAKQWYTGDPTDAVEISKQFEQQVGLIRQQGAQRSAATQRAGEIQAVGARDVGQLTREGGEGAVGQSLRRAVRPSTYGNRGKGGAGAHLEERLITESGDAQLLEFVQGTEGRAGMLRQGTEAHMRRAANRVGLGQSTTALNTEAATALKGLNIHPSQQEQVLRAYEEHLVKTKGIFDPVKFKEEVARVSGAKLDGKGKFIPGTESQAIPNLNEITNALANRKLEKTRGAFGTAMEKYVGEVRGLAGKDLAKGQKGALNDLSSASRKTQNRFKNDSVTSERVTNIEELSRQIEQAHTVQNSAEGRRILEVVNSTLKNKNSSGDEIAKLQQNLSDYLRGKPVEFNLPARRGIFGNKTTSGSAATFTADITKAPQSIRDTLSKQVEYGGGAASAVRDKAFTAEGLVADALSAQGSLITNSTAHMADDVVKLKALAEQGAGGQKVVNRLLKGEVASVKELTQADRLALGFTELSTAGLTPEVANHAKGILSSQRGISSGLRDARRQLANLRSPNKSGKSADPLIIKELDNAIAAVEGHYGSVTSGAGQEFAALTSNISVARQNALQVQKGIQGVGVVKAEQAAPEAVEGVGKLKQYLAGLGLVTGGSVYASRPKAGPVTQARKGMQAAAAWGLSPLAAPVMYRKKVAALSPPVKTKYPKPKDLQLGASPTTATFEAKSKMMNKLRAPVQQGQ